LQGTIDDAVKPVPNCTQQAITGIGQFQTVVCTVKKFDTQLFFQRPNLVGDRTVGNTQFLTGTPHMQLPTGAFKST
jgi:hypothetical protein